jgi:hypothetical protein
MSGAPPATTTDQHRPPVAVSESEIEAREKVLAARRADRERDEMHARAAAEFRPAGQRGGKGGTEFVDQQVEDADGRIGAPLRKVDTLTAMSSRGTISDRMLQAGRRFQRAFEDAYASDACAIDWLKVGVGHWREPDFIRTSSSREFIKAMAALGGRSSPSGSACWYILGEGLSIKDWARLHPFGRRCLSEKAAAGVLVGALGVLEAIWSDELNAWDRSQVRRAAVERKARAAIE